METTNADVSILDYPRLHWGEAVGDDLQEEYKALADKIGQLFFDHSNVYKAAIAANDFRDTAETKERIRSQIVALMDFQGMMDRAAESLGLENDSLKEYRTKEVSDYASGDHLMDFFHYSPLVIGHQFRPDGYRVLVRWDNRDGLIWHKFFRLGTRSDGDLGIVDEEFLGNRGVTGVIQMRSRLIRAIAMEDFEKFKEIISGDRLDLQHAEGLRDLFGFSGRVTMKIFDLVPASLMRRDTVFQSLHDASGFLWFSDPTHRGNILEILVPLRGVDERIAFNLTLDGVVKKDYDTALRKLELVGEKFGWSGALAAERSHVLKRSGDLGAAVEAMRDAVRLDPHLRQWLMLMEVLNLKGDYDELARVLREIEVRFDLELSRLCGGSKFENFSLSSPGQRWLDEKGIE